MPPRGGACSGSCGCQRRCPTVHRAQGGRHGEIVGRSSCEGPGQIRDGLGRAIINFNNQYISGPEKLWATIVACAVLGIVFFSLIRLADSSRCAGGSHPDAACERPVTEMRPRSPHLGVDKQFATDRQAVTTARPASISRSAAASSSASSVLPVREETRCCGSSATTGPTRGASRSTASLRTARGSGGSTGCLPGAGAVRMAQRRGERRLPLELLAWPIRARERAHAKCSELVELSEFAGTIPNSSPGACSSAWRSPARSPSSRRSAHGSRSAHSTR